MDPLLYSALDDETKQRYRNLRRERDEERRKKREASRKQDLRVQKVFAIASACIFVTGGVIGAIAGLSKFDPDYTIMTVSTIASLTTFVLGGIMSTDF